MGSDATALTWGKRAVLGLMAVLLVTFGLRATGSAVARIDLADGSLWVASPPLGMVMQLNSSSDQVLASVKVGTGSVALAQAGHSALVLNRSSGELGRVDGALLEYTTSAISDGPSGDLQLIGNDHGAYVLDAREGRVLVVDPLDRRILHEVSVPQGRGQLTIDSEGRLWALILSTGTVVRVEPDGRSIDAGVAPAESDSSLVLVDDEPYLVNPAADKIVAIDPGTGRPGRDHCLGVSSGQGLVTAGTTGGDRPLALVVDPAQGQLITSDLDGDSCVTLRLTADGERQPASFGRPVTADGLAFIPALDKGQVLVVDLAENRLLQSVQVVEPTSRFELIVDDGTVWFNSLDSHEAGTLDRDGIRHFVRKWGQEGVGRGNGADGLALSADGQEGVDLDPDTGTVETDGTRRDEGEDGGGENGEPRAGEGEPGSGELDGGGSGLDLPEAELEILPADGSSGSDLPPVPLPSGPGSAGPGPIGGGSTMRPLPVGPSGGDEDGSPRDVQKPGQGSDPNAVERLTPEFTFDPRAPLVGQPVRFFDTTKVAPGAPPPSSWSWDFGDGTPAAGGKEVQHVYTAAGTFLVRLTVSNGPETGTTVPVSITVTDPALPGPAQPDFTYSPVNPEVGQSIAFEARTLVDPPSCCPVTEWRWNFGDNSEPRLGRTINHTYDKPGEYKVTLTAVNAASPGFVTKVVNVALEVKEPVAAFEWSPQNPAVGQAVTFRDTSTGAVESRQWRIDGREPTIATFTYAFNEARDYNVRLTVRNEKGSDTVTRRVTVSPAAEVPEITALRAVPENPAILELVALRARAKGGPTSWTWDFADGTSTTTATGELSEVAHQWTAPGTYTVEVRAKNANGESEPRTVRIVVKPTDPTRMQADFRVSKGNNCLGDPAAATEPIQFQDTTIGGPPVRWDWDFGDGTTGQGPAVSHAYASPGIYFASMLVTDAAGNEAIDAGPICVVSKQAPQADFSWSPAQPVAGQPVQFTDLSKNSPTRWFWNFGDGVQIVADSTNPNPVHTYAAAGSYRVTLTVVGDGRPSERVQTIEVSASVKDPPAADFVVHGEAVAGQALMLEAITPGGVTTPVFTISGPKGTTQLSPNPGERQVSYTPPAAGAYQIDMQVCWADAGGNCGSASKQLQVGEAVAPPVAAISVSPVLGTDGDKKVVQAGTPITFAVPSPVVGTSYSWVIGGEQQAPGAQATKTFTQGGDIPVSLTATNEAGTAQAQEVVRVVVATPPTAAFESPDQSWQSNPVPFTDRSQGQVTSWQWDFGDGNGSTAQSPQHAYAAPGNYVVTLTVGNEWGQSSANRTVQIDPLQAPEPQVQVGGATDLGNGSYQAAAGTTLSFADVSDHQPLSTWTWQWGDGTQADAAAVQRSFPAGTYHIVLVVKNPAGEKQVALDLVVS